MACNWAIGTSSFNPAYTTASCPVKLITKVPLAMTEVPATEPIWSKCKKPNDLSCAILGLFPRFSSQGLLSTLRGGCTKIDCREEDIHSKRFPHLGWIIRYKPKQQQGIRRSRLGSQPCSNMYSCNQNASTLSGTACHIKVPPWQRRLGCYRTTSEQVAESQPNGLCSPS